MMKLENFVGMMTGHFDNKDQFDKMQEEGKTYPYAEHINTICNDKINNLPEDFKGIFVVEERCRQISKSISGKNAPYARGIHLYHYEKDKGKS